MAAAVCGNKRSFFDNVPSSPPVSKRLRCGSASASASPTKFTPPQLLDRLQALFPYIEPQLLKRALEECNDDLDSAIEKLKEFCSQSDEEKSAVNEEMIANSTPGRIIGDENTAASDLPSDPSKLPENGAEWVDLFVAQLTSATSMDDAKVHASRVLEVLEKSILAHAADGAAENLQKENMMLKEHIDTLLRENSILKRAVAVQHERQKEFNDRKQEMQQLKQLVSQYQERLRTLEINNYALSMHLKQAEQSSSIPGRFHPDVF